MPCLFPDCYAPLRRLASGLLAVLALVPALVAVVPSADDSGLHTFTNTQGVSMKAAIVSVTGDEVSLTRDDGQKYAVTISIFSADDQAYIRQWAAAKDNTVPTTATAPSLAEAPEAPTPATAPSSDASATGAAEAGSPHAPTLAVFPTLTDADVHKFTTKHEVLYLTIESIDGEQVIAREWKITDLSGKVLPETHRLDLKDFILEDQARIKALVAQRAQDMAAKQNIPGNDGAVHIVIWNSVIDKYINSSHIPPYLVDASGVLKGKTITTIAGNGQTQFALCSDGTLAAWGNNWGGQLGNGKAGIGEYSVSPVLVNLSALKGKKITAIKCINRAVYALCSDDSLYNWGVVHSLIMTPTLFDPGTLNGDASALKGKKFTDFAGEDPDAIGDDLRLATCTDGTMLAWDNDHKKYLPVNATGPLKGKNIAAISYERGHYMVLCADGTIVHWGFCSIPAVYGPGQPGFDAISAMKALPKPTLEQMKPLVLEYEEAHTNATPVVLADDTGLLKGKTVTAIADYENYSKNRENYVGGFQENFTRITFALGSTMLALCSDGTVACWGAGRQGPFPFSVNDDPVVKDALKGKTVKTILNENSGFLLVCSDGTLVHWIFPLKDVTSKSNLSAKLKVAVYHYFDGKTILGADSNAVMFK